MASGALASLRLSSQEPWQRGALEAVREIYRLSQEKPEAYELDIQRLLLGIWSGLYRHLEGKEKAPSDLEKVERLRSILDYLHRHYGEKITLEEVARQVGLCKSECCRFFRRQMHQSLFEYLLDYRIGRSLPLLKEGRATVAEAASQVGFSNPAYFSKVFRSRMKRSPREYQKQSRL